jgi:hypothetical protein
MKICCFIAFLFLGVGQLMSQNLSCTPDRDIMLIGERNVLKIALSEPLTSGQLTKFSVLEAQKMSNKEEKELIEVEILEAQLEQQTLLLYFTVWDSGTVVLPPFAVDEAGTMITEAVMFKSEFPVTDESGDIADIYEFVVNAKDLEVPFFERFWWLILFGLAALFVAGLVLVLGEKPIVSAAPQKIWTIDERALHDLDALEKRGFFLSNQQKEHFDVFSMILKRYLAGRFKIDTFDKTTTEISQQLKRKTKRSSDLATIERLLNLSDIIKYSKANTQEAQIRLTLDEARNFVKETTAAASLLDAEKGEHEYE